jgi:hypothetical protein
VASITGAPAGTVSNLLGALTLTVNSGVTVPAGGYLTLAEEYVGTADDLVVAAAPEPTSVLLLGLAAAPIALGRRKRRAVDACAPARGN